MKVKAAISREVDSYKVETIDLSEPQEGEVLVRIIACGICKSDFAVLKGVVPMPRPTILGHEGVGVVEKVGPGVTTHKPGDKVILCLPSCGDCDECKSGHSYNCEIGNTFIFGGAYRDGTFRAAVDGQECSAMYMQGGFADHAIASANCAIVVDIDEEELKDLCSLGCGAMTGSGTVLEGLKPEPGSSIAVFGTGGVGNAALMAAKIAGCSTIIAVDIDDARLEQAKEFGATHGVNSKTGDPVEQIKEITGGKGVNYSLECTGVPVVILNALDCLATRGACCLISVTGDAEVPINLEGQLMNPNRILRGLSKGGCDPRVFIPRMVEHYKKGEFPINKLVKHYSFDEIETAMDDMAAGRVVKPILNF